VFLAVARGETLSRAGRVLKLDAATVGRRVQRLEGALGARLFTRSPQGYGLTDEGARLIAHAEAVEAELARARDALAGPGEGISGQIRIGAPDGCANYLLPQVVTGIAAANPGLEVQIVALPRVFNLSRREADIVISLERPTRGSVIVSRLSDYSLYLYGQREYLARKPLVASREDLRHHAFVSYVDDLLFTKELQFLDALHQPERFAFRSTSITAQYEAVRAGAGLAVLPAFLADRDPVLTRVLPQEGQFTRTFWMSMPSESKHLARMQVTWAYLRETVAAQQELLKPKAVR